MQDVSTIGASMLWYEQAVSVYLAEAKGRYLSPATYKNKRKFLARLGAFLAGRELNEETARAYCASLPDKGWSPRSAYAEIVSLRTFLKFCFGQKYFTDYFIENIKKPKLDGEEPQIPLVNMETAEQAILLGTEVKPWYNKAARRANEDMRIVLLLILYTGLRFEEVGKLRGGDLFLNATPPHVLAMLKGRKQKTQVYLPKEAVALLRPIADKEQLFHVSNDASNRALNRGLKAMGILFRVTCHGLRHIVGNEENRQGMPAYFLQKHMHHRKFETTVKYYLQNNLDDLAHQVDLYNPMARRSLTVQDKLNALYDQVRRWIGNDEAITVENRNDELVVSIVKRTS